MSLREFYKSHYALEVTRKTDLTAALSLPAGLLTLLVGALVAMAKELHLPLGVVEQIQLVAIVLSGCACASAGYLLFRSLHNYEYGYAPTPLQLREYKEKLTEFHQSGGLPLPEAIKLAETEALNYIDAEYAKNADRNATNNDIKSAFLHRSNKAIIAAVLFGAIAGIAYVINSVFSPQPVQKIEVINLKEVHLMPDKILIQAASSPTPTPPPPVQRPEPPPSRVIKEDRNPPKPPPLKK